MWSLIIGGLMVLAFVFTSIFGFQNLSLISSRIFYEPWRLLTYVFVHGDFFHLFSNLFALLIFGSILEKIIGKKNFLLIFFLSSFISGTGSIIFYSHSLGAFGAIFGILGSLSVLRPKTLVWVMGVPMYLIVGIVIWGCLDILGIFYPDNTAHFSHLFGLVFGIITGTVLRKKFPEPKKPKTHPVPEKELEKWEEKWMKRSYYKNLPFR